MKSGQLRNTRIDYMYRDASNYKRHGFVIIEGVIKLDVITQYLDSGVFFIASHVGFPDLFFPDRNEDDHEWHEISSVEQTEEAPSINVTSDQLIVRLSSMFKYNYY